MREITDPNIRPMSSYVFNICIDGDTMILPRCSERLSSTTDLTMSKATPIKYKTMFAWGCSDHTEMCRDACSLLCSTTDSVNTDDNPLSC